MKTRGQALPALPHGVVGKSFWRAWEQVAGRAPRADGVMQSRPRRAPCAI